MEANWWVQAAQQMINGVSLGSIYALIALGYTMVYGVMRLINFAHGDIYMLGAYVGFFATTVGGMSFFPALLTAMVVMAIVGVLVERIAYRPMRNSPKIALLITAIGVSLFIEYTTMFIMTPQPRTFPPVFENTTYHVGPLLITLQQLVILGSSLALMVILTYIVQHTKMGKAMRAVSYDAEAARLMGIHVDRVISFTFAVGSGLAGAAGVLVGVYYNAIDPLMGIMPGLKAFVAAVLGGVGIIPGAMFGGLILGVVEALVSGFISSTFRDAAAFTILILILLIKPTGLLGRTEREKV
ncbi:MAG: branched-chain amino acid ABC transporter permease [Veillonellaceae bacterium]|nr:branched-chain amino acid ABC transporter permease [Veillonellaceae bacterium]